MAPHPRLRCADCDNGVPVFCGVTCVVFYGGGTGMMMMMMVGKNKIVGEKCVCLVLQCTLLSYRMLRA
jgi:hypothetical protein